VRARVMRRVESGPTVDETYGTPPPDQRRATPVKGEPMGLLIKNGEIVTAADRTVADLYCDGGKIVAIGESLEKRSPRDEVLDASGQFVFPGFIDPHVHMELPFMGTVSADDFESGTASGVAGGTTSIIDFCIPARGESLLDAL